LAFLAPRRRAHTAPGETPPPWITGLVALALGLGVMFTPPTLNWGAFALILAMDAMFLALVGAFSRLATWTLLHTFSLGAGGALAYGLHAFFAPPLFGGWLVARISNAIFLAAAVAVIVAGARRTARVVRLRRYPLAEIPG
jgi:hypothetical protein